MLYHSSSDFTQRNQTSELEDYEKFFRSPASSSDNGATGVLRPPIEPSPLSLDGEEKRLYSSTSSHPITPDVYRLSACNDNGLKSDTRDAALLLTSLKKLAVKEEETVDFSKMLHVPSLTPKPAPLQPKNAGSSLSTAAKAPTSLSQLCSVYEETFEEKNRSEGGTTNLATRARAVSVDSHHLGPIYLECDSVASSFRTDALPKEQISLDLTSSDQKATPAHVSPPSSPKIQSYRRGPQGLSNKKKRPGSELKATSNIGTEPMDKKKKQRARPSILRTKEIKQEGEVKNTGSRKILRKKFSWKSFPELEGFLIANREEYLRHSAMNYTMQQKEYNNRLTERLLELASECGYVFDEDSFSFVSIRDRIRCYFKSYVQSKKKRGLILGYAARRKGLITEEELEKSAGIKGTIVVPKKSAQKKAKMTI